MSMGDICYVLSGEFDNKYGPTITCQYPRNIPGFETVKDNQEVTHAALLASLMIPNNVEHRNLTVPDCNVFTLFLNETTKIYQLLPPFEEETVKTDRKAPNRISFINLVKTESDPSNPRGAKIRSIALGTTLTDVEIFKPFLTDALVYILQAGNVNLIKNVLKKCFQVLNSLDLSYIERRVQDNAVIHVLRSVRNRAFLKDSLSGDTQFGKEMLRVLALRSRDKHGNRIELKKGKLLVHFDNCLPDILSKNLARKPIEMSLFDSSPSQIKTNGLQIFRFLEKFIPVLAKMPSSHYCFKLIINSNRLPKEHVCHFVNTLSRLMGCFIKNGQTRYYDETIALILPYAEISMLKSIRDFFTKCDSSKLFAIIGTANPIFQHHNDLCDYHYDMDKDVLSTSNGETATNRNSLWESNILKKLLQKNIEELASYQIVESGRIGLLAAFINLINAESPKEEYILPTLKKINVLQIESQQKEVDEDNSSLCSSYVTGYKDFVKFNEFFTQGSSRMIRLLSTVDHIMSDLYGSTQSLMKRQESLTELDDKLGEIYSFIQSSDEKLMIFLNVGLNYSSFRSLCDRNLKIKDFSSVNVRQEVIEASRKSRTWMSIVDNGSNVGFFETFTRNRFFDMLSLPLLLNPDVFRPKVVKATSIDRTSTDNLSLSSVSSGTSDFEARRPRSMSLKWIMNFPKNLDNLMEGQSLPWSDLSSTSSTPTSGRVTIPKSSNSGSNSSASSISSLSSRKLDPREFSQKTENVKRSILKILSKIKSHPIGNFLISHSMSSFSRTLYKVLAADLGSSLEATS